MEPHTPTRQEAWTLLTQYTQNESLLKHALAVEAVMRFFAQRHGEDPEKWGVIGLVHDLDYERFPEQHGHQSKVILTEQGWPPDYVRAVLSHGWGICTDVEPQTLLEKTLYAVDELVGFVIACALVRPSRSVMDLEVSSVKKKWKQKAFAAGADRALIEKGAALLGVPLDHLIAEVIAGLRTAADRLGLSMHPGPSENNPSRSSLSPGVGD